MNITKEGLQGIGFKEMQYDGRTIYVKGDKAVVYIDGLWKPCNFEIGIPLSTGIYNDTIEEIEKLIEEAEMKD